MGRIAVIASAVLALGLLSGCRNDAEAPVAQEPPTAVVPVTPESSTIPKAVDGNGDSPAGVPSLLIDTIDGKNYDLAARRGKWVVVNFWATWCAPCIKEMPELSALDAMHEHIEVVGLAYEDIDVAGIREFLQKHPVVYPIAIVDTYDPPADFDTPRGLPMTYLIGPDGKVAKKVLGPVTAEDIETAIAEAGGPAADHAGA
ncbi:MAG: TlpA family protein disulfide reductase [Pseudomonadota bacterium]|nr:TlpA family protein disulfide reductase [Pseudomonadota bacterium]